MTHPTPDPLATARHLKRRTVTAGDLFVAVVATLAVGVPLALLAIGLLTQGGPA